MIPIMKNDIFDEIILQLETGPKTPTMLWNIIKSKKIGSRPTFFRDLGKLKEDGKIRKLAIDEIKSRALHYTGKESYYILVDEELERRKEKYLQILKNSTEINEKNVEGILNELEKYINNLFKKNEYEIVLGFYDTLKRIYKDIPETQLIKYTEYFINVSQRIIKLYKANKEKDKNPYEDLYEKIKSIGKSLFDDYLFLFKKGANRSQIIYPVMDLLNELESLPEKEEFLKLLIADEHIPSNVVKDLLIRYLNYDKKRLNDNIQFIKQQSDIAYVKSLTNNSFRDKELMQVYDDVVNYFKNSRKNKP
jgi:hypothetical protein